MNHRVHHILHFVTEAILLALAFGQQEYVNSLGVCVGLLASAVCFISRSLNVRFRAHWFMLGLLLNSLAILLGILVFGVEISSRLDEGELLSVVAWNIVSFAIIANVVRLNAAAHVYIQWCQELWTWLHTHAQGFAPGPPASATDDSKIGNNSSSRVYVSGYDTSTPAFLRKSRVMKSKRNTASCGRAGRRAAMTVLLSVVCGLGIIFWLIPDASDAFRAQDELCIVDAY